MAVVTLHGLRLPRCTFAAPVSCQLCAPLLTGQALHRDVDKFDRAQYLGKPSGGETRYLLCFSTQARVVRLTKSHLKPLTGIWANHVGLFQVD